MFGHRHREQRRKQRDRFAQGKSVLAQGVFKFLPLRIRGLMGFKPQEALEQIHQRKQCRVLRVFRTPTLPAYMRFISNAVLQHLHQSGFANTCFTSQQDHLSVPSFRLLPTLQEQPNFLLSTYQGSESSRLRHLKASGGTTLAEHLV